MQLVLGFARFMLKIVLWILVLGGTWVISILVVEHWHIYTPAWLVALTIVVLSSAGQVACMAAVDVYGDRARSRAADARPVSPPWGTA